ncbi:hypothetical protein BJ878DRAFT_299719 [Calycina marina]|uniref:Uncharacterized protein n=1 Tax=Calycina marina TaxID=1763456 RepID=A0A9P7YWD3_9HELO|nr:hypothetical protein BJ878DRAFT_299719 [Calycina marina]
MRRNLQLGPGAGTKGILQHGRPVSSSHDPHPAKRRKTDGGIPALVSRANTNPRPSSVAAARDHAAPAPAARSPTVQPKMQYEQDPKMHEVIEKQVLSHVRSAASGYRHSLSKETRDKISIQAAVRIVTSDDFLSNFEENGRQLSSEYEHKVARKAQSYIRESVRDLGPSIFQDQISSRQQLSTHQTRPAVGEPRRWESSLPPQTVSNSRPASQNKPLHARQIALPSRPSPTKKPSHKSRPFSRSSSEDKHSTREVSEADGQHSSSPPTSFTDGPEANPRRTLKPEITGAESPIDELSIANDRVPEASRHQRKRAISKAEKSVPRDNRKRLRVLGREIDRPYRSFADRKLLLVRGQDFPEALSGHLLHVDFSAEEIAYLKTVLLAIASHSQATGDISTLVQDCTMRIEDMAKRIKNEARGLGPQQQHLRGRTKDSICAFLQDAAANQLAESPKLQGFMYIGQRPPVRTAPLSSLVRDREIWGLAPYRLRQGLQTLEVEFISSLEDALVPKVEWIDCCGDISTITWSSKDTFLCGATAHSDHHNMQYNKPGNLGYGNCILETLHSIPDHRIQRPEIDKEQNLENSLDAMRQTQDPWLYTSVVASSYSACSKLAFTASFDKTVKIWQSRGACLELVGSWYHDGNVNFVVTSMHHQRVATASDVSGNAIRIYDLDVNNVSQSQHLTYSGERTQEQAIEFQRRAATWAYYPATIAWGISRTVQNLILVGYSPRSITNDEMDIPEDKRNSGELCLWNVNTGERILIASAHYQNVFEVIWHPTQPIFAAATSPIGKFESMIRTQVRLFAQNKEGCFLQLKTLDCVALDINELTIMPNSSTECYITASCTDGNTYVWDTAKDDRPIHVLGHGKSLDLPRHDVPLEMEDTGVKFAAWGKTSNRFYTGSSDGKVKAWDVEAPRGEAFVRTVLSVSGGVSSGAFSSNYSKLLIGDATGKVHLLEMIEDSDDESTQERGPSTGSLNANTRRKAPKILIPHREPLPPAADNEMEISEPSQTVQEISHVLLKESQLNVIRRNVNPWVGAVQGPNYAVTSFFCDTAHEDKDSTKPLLPKFQALQEQAPWRNWRAEPPLRVPTSPTVQLSSSRSGHNKNMATEFNITPALERDLSCSGIDLDFSIDEEFTYNMRIAEKMFKVRVDSREQRRDSISSGSISFSSVTSTASSTNNTIS